MTATEVLRKEVKQYIDEADDKSLRIVKAILKIELEDKDTEEDEDWWDELPEELQALIETGLKESEQGGGIPHEEIVKIYSKWFKK